MSKKIDDNFTKSLQDALFQGSIEKVQLLLKTALDRDLILQDRTDNFTKCRSMAKTILYQNIDTNFPDTKYPTLLHFAATCGDDDTFRMVLHNSKKCNINALNPEGFALLHVLINMGKETAVKEIVDCRTDLNLNILHGHSKKTPLHFAVLKNQAAIVRLLIGRIFDLNLIDERNSTALDYAMDIGNKEVIDVLWDAGAEIKGHIDFSKNALEASRSSLNKKMFLSEPALDLKETYKISSVMKSETNPHSESGSDINIKGSCGPKEFLNSCGRSLKEVERLVALGADLHARDDNGQTALHYAAFGDNTDIVDFLLRSGLNINSRDEVGDTPLRYIISCTDEKCYLDMIEFLIDNGADVDSPDLDEDTEYEDYSDGSDVNMRVSDKEKDDCEADFSCSTITCASEFGNLAALECLLEFKASLEFWKGNKNRSLYSNAESDDDLDDFNNATFRHITAYIALKEDDILPYMCAISEYEQDIVRWVRPFFKKCKLEIEKMKYRRICEARQISFFDFLTKELFDLVAYARCEELMMVFESGKYKKEFPSYDFFFRQRVERIIQLRNYMMMIEDFLKEYTKLNLPDLVLREIFSYLSVGEVRNFGRALIGWKT